MTSDPVEDYSGLNSTNAELSQPAVRLPAGLSPQRVEDATWAAFGREVVVASERGLTPVVLDAVTAAIWRSLSLGVTISELAEDLQAAVGGSIAERYEHVSWAISSLALHGMVDLPGIDIRPTPRRLYPPLNPLDCLGQTLGLRGATLVQVAPEVGAVFRVGSNDIRALDFLYDSGLELSPLDSRPLPLWFLRVSKSATGRRRAQLLLDGMGNRLYLSWAVDEAIDALQRTVKGFMMVPHLLTVEGPVLATSKGALLIHPSLREVVLDALRPLLRSSNFLIPSVVNQLDDEQLVIPGPGDGRLPILGAMIPSVKSDTSRVRQLLHLATRWDERHVSGIVTLASRLRTFEVPHEILLEDLRQTLTMLISTGDV